MSGKKRKKLSITSGAPPNSEINVTPLVDVVLVLLIIFMVVTPLLEKDILVKVPDTEKVEDVTEVPPDQLIVSVTAAGELKINTETVTEADYVDKMKRILAARKPDDKLVFFMPDDKANYGKLVVALDGARLAGADTLGMMTEKPEGLAIPGADGAPVPADGAAPEGAAPSPAGTSPVPPPATP